MEYQKISSLPEHVIRVRNQIKTDTFNGNFWKACPGTGKGYLCCGYQIITPFVGCGMYCSYCVLQEYFESSEHRLYENFDDLKQEVREKLSVIKKVVRIGTGEFADSLYLEHIHGLSRKIISVLEPFSNALIELKTKSSRISPLKYVQNPSKVVIGFSINTERVIDKHEVNTAPLMDRILAARECEKMGFWVAFHFDPIFWYPQWQVEYRKVIQTIFANIQNPGRIAWWSLGGFRTMPVLKRRLRLYKRHVPLFTGEMVLGADKKFRYFRPIRVELYTLITKEIEKFYPEIPLYLCMENPEIWKESGLIERIPNGLPDYLDSRAKKILGIS